MTWRTVGLYDQRVAVEAHSGGQVIVGSAYDSYQAAQFKDVDDLRAFMAWLTDALPTPEPECITDENNGATFTPFIGDDLQVGYRVVMPDGAVRYFYLMASTGSLDVHDDPPCLFVYDDDSGDPASGCTVNYYNLDPQERTSP